MNVIHLCTFDYLGGAGRAAYRLHHGMLNYGINSQFLTINSLRSDEKEISTISGYFAKQKILLSYYMSLLSTRNSDRTKGLFSCFDYGVDVSKKIKSKNIDAIYIHWVNYAFLSANSIKKILDLNKPTFWFLHDMFPITGGCHHSFDCKKYEQCCSKCPYFPKSSNLLFDSVKFQFLKKMNLYAKYNNLSFIAPSHWLQEAAKKSKLTRKKDTFYIPNFINNNSYKKINRSFSREILGINQKSKIITFGADAATNNPYKGWNYLKESLKLMSNNEQIKKYTIELLVFGSRSDNLEFDSVPFRINFIGKVFDDYTLNLIYCASDVFVSPSLGEAFGQTLLESISSGTPVVGFNVGGIPDLINSKNGYLAKYRDSKDLANGIAYILNNQKIFQGVEDSLDSDFSEEEAIKKHFGLLKIEEIKRE